MSSPQSRDFPDQFTGQGRKRDIPFLWDQKEYWNVATRNITKCYGLVIILSFLAWSGGAFTFPPV
jgi:hypothetical protein